MSSTVVIFAVLIVTGVVTARAFRDRALLDRWIFRPHPILVGKEYHRLVTSGLLHADWWHFGFNAFGLLMFGRVVADSAGWAVFLLVYLSAIVGGSLLSLIIHRHEDYAALGASGGVSGLVFAATFFNPDMGVSLLFLPILAPAWISALVFIGVSFFGTRHRWGNIGHDAHLGGALIGLAVALAADVGQVLRSDWKIGVVVAAGVVALVLLVRFPHGLGQRLLVGSAGNHKSNLRYQDYDRARERNAKRARLDAFLDKISRHGMHSLTPAERRELDELSKHARR
jgi:membrane associated rhomboid family serine protease